LKGEGRKNSCASASDTAERRASGAMTRFGKPLAFLRLQREQQPDRVRKAGKNLDRAFEPR
jgi:hypothetical protein